MGMKLWGLLVSTTVVLCAYAAQADTYVMDLENEPVDSLFRMMNEESTLQIRLELTPQEYNQLKSEGYVIEPVQQYSVMGYRVETSEDETLDAASVNWPAEKMQTLKAHELNNSKGSGQKVCVVDTGVDKSHSLLAGKVISFTSRVPDQELRDVQGHGTHVASLIAGSTELGSAAPQAKIIAVKALADNGYGDTDWISAAIDDCRLKGANVINMSLGSPFASTVMEKAIRRALDAGITIVAATGNDGGKIKYPAAYSGVIAVGATNRWDSVPSFSCRGANIKFVAPGERVLGARAGGGTVYMTGTSMAAPFVAGLVALKNSRSSKGIKADKLKVSASIQGNGRVNAYSTAINK